MPNATTPEVIKLSQPRTQSLIGIKFLGKRRLDRHESLASQLSNFHLASNQMHTLNNQTLWADLYLHVYLN